MRPASGAVVFGRAPARIERCTSSLESLHFSRGEKEKQTSSSCGTFAASVMPRGCVSLPRPCVCVESLECIRASSQVPAKS